MKTHFLEKPESQIKNVLTFLYEYDILTSVTLIDTFEVSAIWTAPHDPKGNT